MKRLTTIIFSSLLALITNVSIGSTPIRLDNSIKEPNINGKFIDVIEVDDEFTNPQESNTEWIHKLNLNTNEILKVRDISKIYWFRFRVQDLSSNSKKWLFENYYHHLGVFELYWFNGYQYSKLSSVTNINEISENKHKSFVYDLNPPKGKISPYYYIRVKPRINNPILFKIRSTNYFVEYSIIDYYLLGIFYGILIIILIYSLFIYFSNKYKQDVLHQLRIQLDEKARLKDKVNEELEALVELRTNDLKDTAKQLRHANEQLVEQQKQLNLMNLKLDVANSKLRKEVRTLATHLTSGRTVSYEEFGDVYPTKESCYILISELKWDTDFSCRKCGHDGFCTGRSFRARRCTRCAFDESVTNFTLFKSIKIPLQKAFYMTYLVFKSKTPVSATEVSKIIDLRLSTCFHFIKKVENQLESAKQSKARINDWTDLVVMSNSKELVY